MLGLYIHIPFCRQKCFYCDFFSAKYDEDIANEYVEALIMQAKQFEKTKIDTIYIGGGTPSILSYEQIEKLILSLKQIFDLSQLKEWTFETNPESIDKEKLKLLKDLKIDRLSIGLQSYFDKDLEFLGRLHNCQKSIEVLESAKEAGFDNINMDLIYGLPLQDINEWRKTLKETLKFDCNHISLYPLSVEKETPLYKQGVQTDDNLQNDLYKEACSILKEKNYIHYEISNWAKKGKESLHNCNYWKNYEYIGLGAGAAGFLNSKRYKNIENTKQYITCVKRNLSPIIEEEFIDEEMRKIENIMLGLRLLEEGADISNFDSKEREDALNDFLKQKALIKDNNKIKLAKDYVFLSNSIISQFMKNSR